MSLSMQCTVHIDAGCRSGGRLSISRFALALSPEPHCTQLYQSSARVRRSASQADIRLLVHNFQVACLQPSCVQPAIYKAPATPHSMRRKAPTAIPRSFVLLLTKRSDRVWPCCHSHSTRAYNELGTLPNDAMKATLGSFGALTQFSAGCQKESWGWLSWAACEAFQGFAR